MTPGNRVSKAKVSVTESNMQKAAVRLLGTTLVSVEMSFVQRELGTHAGQDAIDAKVVAVRALPWVSIMHDDM